MNYIKAVTLVLLSILFLTNCAENDPGNRNSDSQISESTAFFAERSQSKTGSIITLIRLKQPALLNTAEVKNGKVILNEKAKEALLLEQSEVISQLKQISPDVRIIYKYRLSLNGIAALVPKISEAQIAHLAGVEQVIDEQPFDRPDPAELEIPILNDSQKFKKNSTTFIGAKLIQDTLARNEQPIDGTNIKVGIIDTGIDYTHKMLGGSGNPTDFEANDPDSSSPLFPNKKVVGGIDLVGSGFNTSAEKIADRIPKPDSNPMDQMGHGTHVAGTVAGIGDGVHTYNGVAPNADLYAIKVFGDSGSTSDTVVIAALEWALDPNGDLNLEDKLDVVNLSLGGGFGKPHLLYNVAVKNFTKSGSVMVASAGNSGDVDNIVGAPSTSDEAISVAASIDDMEHNWKFPAIEFNSGKRGLQVVELVEGAITEPIYKLPDVSGSLVYIGYGEKELTETEAAKVKGKVALMDRGKKINFVQKLTVAQKAGAIGVVMVNNQPGAAIVMGGKKNTPFPFPSAMIMKDTGDEIKQLVNEGEDVVVHFKSSKTIDKPELIDTITGFSSKGPRSLDSLIKPEITAPGNQIISAAMGKGDKGVPMNGTSMSGPHVAGVMALLRQYHPTLSAMELKSLLMTSATPMKDDKGLNYPVSRQGAGRVQAFKAATSPMVLDTPALSLGEVLVNKQKVVQKVVQIKNILDTPLDLSFEGQTSEGLKLLPTGNLHLEAKAQGQVTLRFLITNPKNQKGPYSELDGFVKIMKGQVQVGHAPVMAVVNQISEIKGTQLSVLASSPEDAGEAVVDFTLQNNSQNPGHALVFNHLGSDDRKNKWQEKDRHLSASCDLQNAGYRLINKEGKTFLQVGIKLFNSVTRWQHCEVSVQIDGDLDDQPDQELVGLVLNNIAGLRGNANVSALLNAKKVREIRAKYDQSRNTDAPSKGLNYAPAILDAKPFMAYHHSSVAVLEADVTLLKRTLSGELALKLAVISAEGSDVEQDDFLVGHKDQWNKIQIDPLSQAYYDIPEVIGVGPKSTQTVSLIKGEGSEKLLVLYPQNKTVKSKTLKDQQAQLITPSFAFK